nr:immunoglobulin light chain junction region [Macaca mulatta]MOV65985.1 immunoglobulin light chain junction region [Macaca mulatta]MOV66171.1 immunoglobulin light chain junction region [Macaca mulatta]MOV66185.1 immunoglobulin light chain junction region [Macaca mulatta]MOV66416.1 immunoglobulin light chain junction region [Macaca mulatta]
DYYCSSYTGINSYIF